MEANSSTRAQHGHVAGLVEIGISHWPVAVTTVIALVVAFALPKLLDYFRVDPTAKLPRVGSEDLETRLKTYLGPGSWDLYKEGYEKFKDSAFKITDVYKRDRIVLPHTFLPELAKYTDDVLNHEQFHSDTAQVEYILPDVGNPVFRRVLLSNLTPAMARLTSALREELVEVMSSELPSSSEWTETTIDDKLWRIISKSTGRIFTGPECCREPAYLKGSINFSLDLSIASREIRKIPRLLRPFLAPRLATTKAVRRHLQDYVDILGPVIQQRKKDAASQGSDYQKPEDMTQWMIDMCGKIGQKEVLHMAFEQSIISFSGINAEVQFTAAAIYTLAAYPELAPMLLEDVNQALNESGGEWTNAALQNMKKLDSFLKEVGRCQPSSAYSFARKVMSPITLSNGMRIPKNTIVEVDWYGISRDENIYPDPEKFDALRFYNLRTEKEKVSNQVEYATHFTNVSPTYLAWNYGRHSCPGRYFAGNHVKLIFATLLLRYEIRNAEGVEGRAKNLRAIGHQSTDPKNKIRIRTK